MPAPESTTRPPPTTAAARTGAGAASAHPAPAGRRHHRGRRTPGPPPFPHARPYVETHPAPETSALRRRVGSTGQTDGGPPITARHRCHRGSVSTDGARPARPCAGGKMGPWSGGLLRGRDTLSVGDVQEIHRLPPSTARSGPCSSDPAENLLRTRTASASPPTTSGARRLDPTPSRTGRSSHSGPRGMQDFTAWPAIVDLPTCARRCATSVGNRARINRGPRRLGSDPPSSPTLGTPDSFSRNVELVFGRDATEPTSSSAGGQGASPTRGRPAGHGIVTTSNRNLARGVHPGRAAYRRTMRHDSHTTNGQRVGVLGGAAAASRPRRRCRSAGCDAHPAVGRIQARRRDARGLPATDLGYDPQMSASTAWSGSSPSSYKQGVGAVPLANRATIGNKSRSRVAPAHFRSTRRRCATGSRRPDAQVAMVEAVAKEQGLWHDAEVEPAYSETSSRPPPWCRRWPAPSGRGRVALSDAKPRYGRPARHADGTSRTGQSTVDEALGRAPASERWRSVRRHQRASPRGTGRRQAGAAVRRTPVERRHGTRPRSTRRVVLAAITSAPTTPPAVMLGAALLARRRWSAVWSASSG